MRAFYEDLIYPQVFEAEKMSSRERWYHKHCFNCAMCSHKLDYSNSMEVGRPDSTRSSPKIT